MVRPRSNSQGFTGIELLTGGVGCDPGTPTRMRVPIIEEETSLFKLTSNQRAALLTMVNEGRSQRFIASHLGVGISTAWRLIQDTKKELEIGCDAGVASSTTNDRSTQEKPASEDSTPPSVLDAAKAKEVPDLKGLSGNKRALIKEMIRKGHSAGQIASRLNVSVEVAQAYIDAVRADMGLPVEEQPSEVTETSEVSTVMSTETAEDAKPQELAPTSCFAQVGVVMDPVQQAVNRELMMDDTPDFARLAEVAYSEIACAKEPEPAPTFDDVMTAIKSEHEALVARGERLESIYKWMEDTVEHFGQEVATQLYLRNVDLLGVS